MSAIFHAFMSGLTLLVLGAQLISLEHPVVGAIGLFCGLELAAFAVFALWMDRGPAAPQPPPSPP
ncbi:hypothetical protein [Hydrocarboniphaga sp.]|uniref:hypothetical protein n=1 Tax=Hydrocarboniphaga sp. TaxID=2033016 RepID=UPI003D127ABC